MMRVETGAVSPDELLNCFTTLGDDTDSYMDKTMLDKSLLDIEKVISDTSYTDIMENEKEISFTESDTEKEMSCKDKSYTEKSYKDESFITVGDEKSVTNAKAVSIDKSSDNSLITPPMSQNVENIKSPINDKLITRNEFVDSLISAATILIQLIWPQDFQQQQIKWFLKETLRRSRSSYCTLQVALYYIYKLQDTIKQSDLLVFKCPKRCFLVCLIIASKFLQDKNYSMKTWSKISGLNLNELIKMEINILESINYNLNLSNRLYSKWSKLLLICTYYNNINGLSIDIKATSNRLALILNRFNSNIIETNATSFKRQIDDDDEFIYKKLKL